MDPSLEKTVIWGVALLISILCIAGYISLSRRVRRRDRARKAEAAALGMDKAPALFPMIDETKCIGCGICTRSCPMGDEVLGVVDGVSTIIQGVKCIGIGKCALNCPVGAIKIGLGNLEKRDDIPKLDDFFQTNIPRVFIPGELNGQSLIKNAIRQGREVAAEIAKRKHDKNTCPPAGGVDIVIVGAGPAGLTAALAAKEKGLSTVVFDYQAFGGTIAQYPKGKSTLIDPVHLPCYGMLDKYEYPKETVLDIFQDLANSAGLDVRIGPKLTGLSQGAAQHTVHTESHGDFTGTYIVLALGRAGTLRKLDIPGESLPHVKYKLMDPADYRSQHILVVGGGDSAVEAAMALAKQPGNRVTLSYRKHRLFRTKSLNEKRLNKMVKESKLSVLFESEAVKIREKSVGLRHKGEQITLEADSVFIFAGGLPPFRLLKGMGIHFWGESNSELNRASVR